MTGDEREEDAPPRVLIVEDHRLLADGLAAALREDSFDTAVVVPSSHADLEEALSWAPDLVLLDLNLGPLGTAVDLIPRLVMEGRVVLVCTGETNEPLLGDCLAAGAVGVFAKAGPYPQLREAIDTALAGGAVMSFRRRQDLLAASQRHAREAADRFAPFRSLTPAEEAVLARLVEAAPTEAIAAELCVSIWTVRSHVRAILRKLGVSSQLGAVVLARQAGWRPSGEPSG